MPSPNPLPGPDRGPMPSYDPSRGDLGISDAAMEQVYGRSKPPKPARPFRPLFSAAPDDFWPPDLSRAEFAEARKLADEIRQVGTALASENERLSFLVSCRRAVLDERIQIESVMFQQLTFGAFTQSEQLARVDAAEAEVKKRQSDLESRKQKLTKDLAQRAQKLSAAIAASGLERRLDEALLAAESANRAIGAVAEAAAGILPVRGAYSFFASGGWILTPFQRERMQRTKNGRDGAKK